MSRVNGNYASFKVADTVVKGPYKWSLNSSIQDPLDGSGYDTPPGQRTLVPGPYAKDWGFTITGHWDTAETMLYDDTFAPGETIASFKCYHYTDECWSGQVLVKEFNVDNERDGQTDWTMVVKGDGALTSPTQGS